MRRRGGGGGCKSAREKVCPWEREKERERRGGG